MSEIKNNTSNQKQTDPAGWICTKINEMNNKSSFSGWSQMKFSHFLIAIMRYNDISLLLELSPIVKPDKFALDAFLGHIKRIEPVSAARILEDELLKEKPDFWTAKLLEQTLNEQKKKICSRKTSMNSYEIRYGAIDLQSYYFHTQSREFCNSLQKGQGLTVSTFLSRIFDWDEIAQGSNKKNYFLHKEILPKILNAGLSLLVECVKTIGYYNGASMDIKSSDPLIKETSLAAQEIMKRIEPIFETKNHLFEEEQEILLAQNFYSSCIKLKNNDYSYCFKKAQIYLELIMGKDNSLTETLAKLWIKQELSHNNSMKK